MLLSLHWTRYSIFYLDEEKTQRRVLCINAYPKNSKKQKHINTTFPSIDGFIFRISGKHTNAMINSLCDLNHRLDNKGLWIQLPENFTSASNKGLANFIQSTTYCTKCNSPMTLHMGKSGKYILKCSSCNDIELLSIQTLNMYLDRINATCSVCGQDTFAGISKFGGICVRCSNYHYTKISDL